MIKGRFTRERAMCEDRLCLKADKRKDGRLQERIDLNI
jgi:hypothetical protein